MLNECKGDASDQAPQIHARAEVCAWELLVRERECVHNAHQPMGSCSQRSSSTLQTLLGRSLDLDETAATF